MFEKTLGIIGAGRIGQGVGRRCRGFNMKILAYDVFEDESFKKETGAEYVVLRHCLENPILSQSIPPLPRKLTI